MKKILLFVICLFAIEFANAQCTKLHDFLGYPIDGGDPYGDLTSDGTFLYGMTQDGGTNGAGIIFKIKLDGTAYDTILNFSGLNGINPHGSLLYDGTFLYGMTQAGGINGIGVIFKIKPDGTAYSKLLDFADTINGSTPYGNLISDGVFLYGMTLYGGANGMGVIFKIKPDGTGYVNLFDFSASSGGTSIGSLMYDGAFLYGMTNSGGANARGTLFKIMPDGTGYTDLLDFSDLIGRASGSLISDGTFLYGMTYCGGTNDSSSWGDGTIFKIKPDGTGYDTLLNFNAIQGRDPEGSLLYDGTFLYGMTSIGGTLNDGTVFRIKPDGSAYNTVLNFSFGNGEEPKGSLISDGTFLYGMTLYGGLGQGVIFKLAMAPACNAYSTMYDSTLNNFTLIVDSATTAIAIGYHWDFGDGTSSNLATPSHIYTVDSLYNVCMKVYYSSGDSCSYCHIIGIDSIGNIVRNAGFTINVQNANTMGVLQLEVNKNNISIFPNPTNGHFNVIVSSPQKNTSIEIYNSFGALVYSQKIVNEQNNIELTTQPDGLYFIKVMSGGKIVGTRKIVKE